MEPRNIELDSLITNSMQLSMVDDTNSNWAQPSERSHKCVERHDDRGFWIWIVTWYLLPLHLICSAALACVITFVLDGCSFSVGSDPNFKASLQTRLYQSDVTTLVSVSLVIIRLFATAWSSISIWRCAFVLLEKTGLTLQQLSSTIAYGVPTSLFSCSASRTSRNTSVSTYIIFIVCVLLLPSQFAAPILSGSISWSPDMMVVPAPYRLKNIQVAGPGNPWAWYQSFPNVRNSLVLRSSSYASVVTVQSNSHQMSSTWRTVPSSQHLPVNTTISNITIPYFVIQDWSWIQDVTTIPKEILNAVTNNSAGTLNIAGPNNPLEDPIEGSAALLKTTPWQTQHYVNNAFTYPMPRIRSLKQYVAVLVSRIPGQTCSLTSATFGNLPVPQSGFTYINYSNNHTNCYIYASFKLVAAAAICSNCNLSSFSTISAPLFNYTDLEIQPESLVDEILAMLPEVMHTIASMNSTQTSQLGQLDTWTQSLLINAYSATWTSFNVYFGSGDTALEADISIPVIGVRANVNSRRVWFWFCCNGLVTVSGLCLMWVRIGCERKVIVDPVLTAVLLDASGVIERDINGLCNASRLGKEDENLGALRLRQFHVAGMDYEKGHAMLDRLVKVRLSNTHRYGLFLNK
ncbi:hypothetical protein B0J14DRAFT_639209 [Halenospora varia]|nr:hypothetical protein B0J14DRAFT_639209 [Halenospora varia]